MADGLPAVPASTVTGATVQSEYMGRSMKCYAVNETEMENLSTLNGQASLFFSVAAAFLGYASSIWINAIFYTSLTPAGQLASRLVAPLSALIAAVFVVLGAQAVLARRSIWKRIKSDSYSLPAV